MRWKFTTALTVFALFALSACSTPPSNAERKHSALVSLKQDFSTRNRVLSPKARISSSQLVSFQSAIGYGDVEASLQIKNNSKYAVTSFSAVLTDDQSDLKYSISEQDCKVAHLSPGESDICKVSGVLLLAVGGPDSYGSILDSAINGSVARFQFEDMVGRSLTVHVKKVSFKSDSFNGSLTW